MMKNIAVLPGDGIGEEVVAEALRVLAAVAGKFGHEFRFSHGLIGGAAWDVSGVHFPEETRKLCQESDAIFFGSIGGPVSEMHLEKWKNCAAESILALRKTFQFAVNLRPAKVYPELLGLCPLRPEIVAGGVDLLVVRELLGDIYFGEHKQFEQDGMRVARDVAEYTESQIRVVAHQAFLAARKRRKKVTSVDKVNVLDTSKLWRAVVSEVAGEYPDIALEHMLVDNCAMQLIKKPTQFDVILTANLFGDILSDAAAVLPGSLGLMPSASLSERGFGLYEPSGGSAPDIAGLGIANPIAQILSAALMLRHSFQLESEALEIEQAVEKALKSGIRTGDLVFSGEKFVSTTEMTNCILSFLE